MKRYAIFVLFPIILIIIFINVFIKDASRDNVGDYIRKAIASGNYEAAENEYRKLITSDFTNINYHIGYIISYFKLSKHSASSNTTQAKTISTYYMSFLKSEDPNVLDIAHYCLGFIKATENNYKTALSFYFKVQNKYLVGLNNAIGHCYRELGDYEKAKFFFKREIEVDGYVKSALNNYAKILLREKNTQELERILSNTKYKNLIYPSTRRDFFFIKNKFISYFVLIILSYKENVIVEGLIAALLICIIWFLFIKKLDIFEPEKFRFLFLTLFLAVILSNLCYVLYGSFNHYLHFVLKGSILTELAYCIFGIGLIEESVKLVPVFIILFFTKQINESTDFIIYASISALGFAFAENLGYFHEFGLKNIGVRASVCTLLHMVLSSFAIYGLIYSKYKKKSILYFAVSFITACIIHGLYDFPLLTSTSMFGKFALLSFFLVLLSIGIYKHMVVNALNNSEYFREIDHNVSLRKSWLVIVYGLSYVIVVHYLINALKFGPKFANSHIAINSFSLVSIILVIYANFSKFTLKRKLWLPLFKREVPSKRKKHT